MKGWKTWGTYLAGACLALVGLPLLVQEVMYFGHYFLKIRPLQTSIREQLDTFLNDQGLLAEEPFFQVAEGGENAAPYLNFRLDWAPSTPSLVRQLSQNPPRIFLPEPIKEKLKLWGRHFPKFHPQIKYETVDLTWMSEVLGYDYWDLVEKSNAEEVFERKQAMSLYLTQTLAPQFEELVMLAKVRLMKGMWEGELEKAITETRHFAKLLYSTETLMGGLAAIGVLRAERSLADYLGKHIQTDTGGWSPMETKTLDRARRALLGFSAFPTVFTPPDSLRKVFLDPRASVGICPALAKGMLRGLLVRPLLEPKTFLERDFSESFAALDEVVEKTAERCRLGHVKKLWQEKRARLVWLGLVGDHSWDWINLHFSQHVPLLRRAWGIDLSSVFISNGLEAYN